MRLLVLGLVALTLAGATACGADRSGTLRTPDRVAALLRATWGATTGSPSFDYTCKRLDDRGRLFTCLVEDPSGTVKLASFDVVCDASRCRWTDYPSYTG